MEKSRTTLYHPQSDGLVERFNRTLIDMLATAVIDQPFQWEEHLCRLCCAYNTNIPPTMGYPPFTLMFGRQARLSTDIALGTPTPPLTTVTQYADHLQESLGFAPNRWATSSRSKRHSYDTTVHGHLFQVGDLVWLHNPAVPRGRSKKLHQPWNGPYQMVACLSESVYRLKHLRRAHCCPVVHFDHLKLCHKDICLLIDFVSGGSLDYARDIYLFINTDFEIVNTDFEIVLTKTALHVESLFHLPISSPFCGRATILRRCSFFL